jgi:hypothetical protein
MGKLASVVFIIAMVVPVAALSELYEWTDSKGVVNFTDDLNKVPAKYRKLIKERESQLEERNESPAAVTSPPRPQSPAAGSVLYGDHDQGWWRSNFNTLRQGIKSIESNLPGKREKLAEIKRKRVIYQRTRDRVAYNELEADITKDEENLKELQDKLRTLDDEANRGGVPQEWRQ